MIVLKLRGKYDDPKTKPFELEVTHLIGKINEGTLPRGDEDRSRTDVTAMAFDLSWGSGELHLTIENHGESYVCVIDEIVQVKD